MKIKEFIIRNKIILLFYLLSTLFFIYQHATVLSWDFSVYVLNAKYLFNNGFFFDPGAPLLISFLIGLFGSNIFAEYIYIIFASTIFLFACLKFSKNFNLDKNIFYILMLNPITLIFGLKNGTELLSLSLLILGLAYFNEVKKSSLSLSFALLTRYSNILFIFLLFLRKSWKKIFLSIIIFLIPLVPLFLFSWYILNNPLSILGLTYIGIALQSSNFILIVGILFLVFLILRKKILDLFNIKTLLILTFTLITLLFFIFSPTKEIRYLFNLIFPIVYFLTLAIKKYKIKNLIFKIEILILIIFLLIILIIPNFIDIEKLEIYNISSDCMAMSNAWIYLNYINTTSEPYPREEQVQSRINEGYRIILFKNIGDPLYTDNRSFIEQFTIIKENKDYLILGNESICKNKYKVNKTASQRLNEFLIETYNYTIREELRCNIGFKKILCDLFSIA